jgi:tRNA-specific 2-thiouridylase
MEKGKKVFVALSGGVDSSTAAALLLQRGYDCQAMYMITSDMGVDNAEEVKRIAEKLKIKYHILDFRQDFENVIAYFCDEYKKGRTPNPCVFCNRTIKFGKLWQYAKDHGADLIATGHYANIKRDGDKVSLYEIPDYPKDQSYVLSVINKQVLPNILLVMGEFKKNETRQMAEKFDLGTAHKSDSQEICFIPNDDYISLLEQK